MKGGPARGPAPVKAQADDGGDAIPSSGEQVPEPEYLSGEEDYIDSDSEGRDGYRRGLLLHVGREISLVGDDAAVLVADYISLLPETRLCVLHVCGKLLNYL